MIPNFDTVDILLFCHDIVTSRHRRSFMVTTHLHWLPLKECLLVEGEMGEELLSSEL